MLNLSAASCEMSVLQVCLSFSIAHIVLGNYNERRELRDLAETKARVRMAVERNL